MSKTWEKTQAEAAIKRAIAKWGKGYDNLGADLRWAIICVELTNLVYMQQTESEEVNALQAAIKEAREINESL